MNDSDYTLKQKRKHDTNRRRHNFLLETFFPDTPDEAIKEVGNWVLKKYKSGNTGDCEVAIYTKDSYKRYEDYTKREGLFT